MYADRGRVHVWIPLAYERFQGAGVRGKAAVKKMLKKKEKDARAKRGREKKEPHAA